MYSDNTKDFLRRLSKEGEELLSISPNGLTNTGRKQAESVKKSKVIENVGTSGKLSENFVEKELSLDINVNGRAPTVPPLAQNISLATNQITQQVQIEYNEQETYKEYNKDDEIKDVMDENDIDPSTKDNIDAYIKSERVFPAEEYQFSYKTFVEVVNKYILQFSKSSRSKFIPSEEQLRVLYSLSKRLLIESGAGTGKTTIIIIKMFLEQNLMRLTNDDILAITYTREGANSMRQRYDNIRSEFSSSRFLEFRTIHSYCLHVCSMFMQDLKIITETNDAVTYEWDEEEQQFMEVKVKMLDIITEGVQQLSLQKFVSAKSVLGAINTIVEMCITNEQEFRNLEVYTDFPLNYHQIMSIYDYYNRKKKEFEVFDYIDMVLEAKKIFDEIIENKRQNLTQLQKKVCSFKSIYIDEVQDISPLQAEIINKLLILNPDARLTVIGDTDQSIYSFRGASVDYIINFPKEYSKEKTLDVIYLTRNRRSAPNIISLSDKFIKNNKNRFPKNLRGLDGDSRVGNISFYEDTVGFLHKNIILNVIETVKERNIADLGKYAVLYREHKQCTWLINYLVCRRIPFNVNLEYFSEEFVINSKEFKDLIFISHLLRNPSNPDLVKNCLYKIVPSITKAQSERISFEMRSDPSLKLLPFVKKYGTDEDVSDIISLRKLLLENVSPAVFFKALIQKYQKSYYNSYIVMQHKQNRMPDITDYFEYKKDLRNIQNEIDSDSRWIRLNTHNKASITLNTFHISKGLEYENVFILPLSDETSPKIQMMTRSMSYTGILKYIEEERRLLYVAITRARSNLCIFFTPNKIVDVQLNNMSKNDVKTQGSDSLNVIGRLKESLTTEKGLFVTELLSAYEEVLKEYPEMKRQVYYQRDSREINTV